MPLDSSVATILFKYLGQPIGNRGFYNWKKRFEKQRRSKRCTTCCPVFGGHFHYKIGQNGHVWANLWLQISLYIYVYTYIIANKELAWQRYCWEWFACKSPVTKTTEITKMMKTTKTTRQLQTKISGNHRNHGNHVKGTPSLKWLVWIFSGHFPLKNEQDKIHWKIHQKIHRIQGDLLDEIPSGKFLPWGNDENHGNRGCKPPLRQTAGLEIPDHWNPLDFSTNSPNMFLWNEMCNPHSTFQIKNPRRAFLWKQGGIVKCYVWKYFLRFGEF